MARNKNIVLFSDGTGNSSGKAFKTNVWRVYQAVDLTDPQHPEQPRQFAFYDDGVGTSSFKPLAVLGGALGVGLARNVIDLYVFLCRLYEPGDRIYAFGFSRGAFTIRVLVGLVMTQGLLRYHGCEADLHRLAREAYRAYRRERFRGRSPLVWALRGLRDFCVAGLDKVFKRLPYERAERIGRPGEPDEAHIEFLGLWDTVDAYGLPVDELTRAIDVAVWPLTMRDPNLSRRVRRARHALALDDERNAFHPRLWNEQPDPRSPGSGVEGGNLTTAHIDEEIVSQVWFAGVHSDVGGGYPDDSLSYVPLEWMMREANKYGLRFEQRVWEDLVALSDENGPVHDSRRGLGGYYRYNPRRIERLANTPDVKIGRTKVHESVLRRIQVGHDGYAPIVLPPGFAVMKIDGRIVDGDEYLRTMPSGRADSTPPPTRWRMLAMALQAWALTTRHPLLKALCGAAAALADRMSPPPAVPAAVAGNVAAAAPADPSTAAPPLSIGPGGAYENHREHVYNWVWRRRVAYFATLAVTLVLAVMPLVAPGSGACSGALCFLAAPIAMLAYVLPSFAETWTESFSSHPGIFLPLAAALAFGLWRGAALEQRLRDEMRRIWYAVPRLKPSSVRGIPAPAAPGALHRAIQGLRNHPAYQPTLRAFTHYLMPAGFLAALAYGALALGSQVWFAARASWGNVCSAGEATRPAFGTNSPCTPVAHVTKGQTYRVRITVPAAHRWYDAWIPAGPQGLECKLGLREAATMAAAVPLRRHLAQPWFQPMARIGETGNDTYVLQGDPRTAPRRDRGCEEKVEPADVPRCPPEAMVPSADDEVFESRLVARSTGPLFLYVNDAVDVPLYSFYDNNHGCARIEVLADKPPPPRTGQ